MQALAQQRYMWTGTYCESLQHNNSEVILKCTMLQTKLVDNVA